MITRRRRDRAKQKDRRARNKATFWNARYEAAPTPHAKALVAWDHVRATVAAVAPEHRDEAWKQVKDHLTLLVDRPLGSGGDSTIHPARTGGDRGIYTSHLEEL